MGMPSRPLPPFPPIPPSNPSSPSCGHPRPNAVIWIERLRKQVSRSHARKVGHPLARAGRSRALSPGFPFPHRHRRQKCENRSSVACRRRSNMEYGNFGAREAAKRGCARVSAHKTAPNFPKGYNYCCSSPSQLTQLR